MSSTKSSRSYKGIRFRLTFVYSTLFGLFICVFAYITSAQYFQSGRADFDSGLLNYTIDLSNYIRIDHSGLKIDFKIPETEVRKAFPFILNQTFYTVRSYEGELLAKSRNKLPFKEIPYDPSLPLKADYTHRFHSFKSIKETFRAVNLKITNEFGKEMILQVATPYGMVEKRERNHLIITAIIVPLLIIISSFLSYLFAGNALGPIKSLTDTANNIAANNLSLRVPVLDTGDEVEDLAKTLNHLLERMEKSFKGQENFVANASHQLNTPLAIIKGELDVLEAKERSIEEYQRFHRSLREELQRLISLVKNMLLVSRVESGLENFTFYPLRLDDLLLSVTSRLQSKARDKKINIKFNIEEDMTEEQLIVRGEKQLLDSLFENILDNAVKYTPEESSVELSIKIINNRTEVWFRDEGSGFPEEDFQKTLTKRYHRDPSVSIPGTGIGLSIANKIAEYHQAKIHYRRLNPGSLFIVQFC